MTLRDWMALYQCCLCCRLTRRCHLSRPFSAVKSAQYCINSARKNPRHSSHFLRCSLTSRFVICAVLCVSLLIETSGFGFWQYCLTPVWKNHNVLQTVQAPSQMLPSPPFFPFPSSPLPLEVGPPPLIVARESGGALKLPQRVLAEPAVKHIWDFWTLENLSSDNVFGSFMWLCYILHVVSLVT